MWPCPSSGSWPQAADACPPTVTPGSRVPLAVLDEALSFPYGEMCPFSTWVLLFRSSSHFYFYHSKGGENADARGPHRSAPGPGRRGFAHWAAASAEFSASCLCANHTCSETQKEGKAGDFMGTGFPFRGDVWTFFSVQTVSSAMFFCNILWLKRKNAVVC